MPVPRRAGRTGARHPASLTQGPSSPSLDRSARGRSKVFHRPRGYPQVLSAQSARYAIVEASRPNARSAPSRPVVISRARHTLHSRPDRLCPRPSGSDGPQVLRSEHAHDALPVHAAVPSGTRLPACPQWPARRAPTPPPWPAAATSAAGHRARCVDCGSGYLCGLQPLTGETPCRAKFRAASDRRPPCREIHGGSARQGAGPYRRCGCGSTVATR